MGGQAVSVGRATVLAQILRALRRPPQTILITGEAGIGKTHLLGAVAAARHRLRVLRGQARELDEGLPYAPLVDALEALGRDAEGQQGLWELYDAIDRSAGQPGRGPNGAPNGHSAAAAHPPAAPAVIAAHLLAALPGQTLLAIDDVHHADADTLSLLASLPRHVPGLTIICTARHDPPLDADLTIELAPLTRLEVTQLVTQLLGRTPSDEMIKRIHADSRGNPWFVQEAVLTLVQGGAVQSPDPGARRGAILRRVFQRDQGGRELARVLATVGRTRDTTSIDTPGTLTAFGRLAGLDARKAEKALVGLVRDGVLVYMGDGYRFAHPLVAETLYADLTPAERRRLHSKIAELLRKQGLSGARRVLEWVTHVAEGGSASEALPAMLRAAELTRWTAPLSAAHWYGRAADLADVTERGELLARQALSYWKGSRPQFAFEAGQRALELLPPGRRRTRTAMTVVGAAHAMGRYAPALEVAAAQLPDADDGTAMTAQCALVEIELGHERADLVAQVAQGLADCPPEDRVIALGAMTMRAIAAADWPAAQNAIDDLLAFAAASPPAARLASLETAAHMMATAGVRGRAVELLDQAEQIHRGLGWHDLAGQNVRTRAVIRRLSGEWEQALADIEIAGGALAEAGLMENYGLIRNMELEILIDQGRYDEADRVLADEPPDGPLQRGLRAVLAGRVALGRGDRAAARRHVEHALQIGPGDVRHKALAVQAMVLGGADLTAARAVSRSLDEVAATGTPRAQMGADLVAGWAFQDKNRAGAALERARADGLPFEEARARLVLAIVGDTGQLARAHAIFTELGAVPWRERTATRLREAGLAPSSGGALTPSERKVIELVAGGKSNPQIAEELHYSRKTVEVYLTRVYAKTGLRSRVELALAVERGEL
ncbi:AAA family ATPase [Streptosporangiaceae bacterium NEAU-GS5]|nr:AAA family ATPase [Streptosporangiaceae bacterium NEAU-GS5]